MEPIRAFHGTLSSFERFVRPARGIGIHFGTKPQALQRVCARMADYVSGFKVPPPGRVIEVDLDLRNPLRMPDIGGWHCPIDVRQAIDEQYPGLVRPDVRMSTRAQLIAAGHDGIVYLNQWEIPPNPDLAKEQLRRGNEIEAEVDAGLLDWRSPEYRWRHRAVSDWYATSRAATRRDSYAVFEPDQITIIGECCVEASEFNVLAWGQPNRSRSASVGQS